MLFVSTERKEGKSDRLKCVIVCQQLIVVYESFSCTNSHTHTHTFVFHLFLFHPSHSNLHICFINSFSPSLARSLCLCMSIFIAHISNQYIKTCPHTNTRAYTSNVSYMLASVISFPIVKWKVNKLPTFLFSYTFFYVYICIFIPNKKNSYFLSLSSICCICCAMHII